MVSWKHFSIHKSVLEEVEKINDIDVLKKIVRTLVRENLILSRRTNTALKSLENQNILIKYLQQTLVSVMARNAMQANELWAILGSETLRTFDDVVRYQLLIHEVANRNKFGEDDQRIVEELKGIALTVPYDYVRSARSKCVNFLNKIKNRVYEETDDEDNTEAEGTTQEIARSSKFQNGRINIFAKKRKRNYREIAKKKACSTSRKHSLNKSQNSKSESSGRKNFRSNTNLANSSVTSQSGMENVQPKKFPGRRKLKRKAVEINDESSLNLDQEKNLASVNKPSVKETEPIKKIQRASNHSISNSIDETFKLKPLIIELKDFMVDPSSDNDQYVAQYKQVNVYRDNEDNEFEILDEANDDSSHNSDVSDDENEKEDRIPSESHNTEDNNQESALSKSTACEENAIAKDKKGPCTPPSHSPVPDGKEPCSWSSRVRRGPRTPSLSPPMIRRGPCTPPGVAPTSDSEATDDEIKSSTSSSTY